MALDSCDLFLLRLAQQKHNLMSEPMSDRDRRPGPLSPWMLNLQSVRTDCSLHSSVSVADARSFMCVALRHILKLQVSSLRQSRTRVRITHCWYKVTQIWDQLFLIILLQVLQLWVRECLTKASFNSEMPLCRFWICLKIQEICTYLHGS